MSLPEPDAVELLRGAIFDGYFGSDTAKWYELARKKAPLWTFDKWAFNSLRVDDLPSSFPLRRIIKTIAEDEGVDLDGPHRLGPPVPLLSYLSAARGGRSEEGGYGGIPDMDTSDPSESPIWGLGMEVLARLEDVEAASTKKERNEVRKELDRYLNSLGARLSQGRPTRGAPQRMLDPLFEQGKWLFGTCWQALPWGPSAESCKILTERGALADDCPLWAIRLALPMLSVAEIGAMLREIAEPYGQPHTRPRRFTIFSIAHRLRCDAKALAYRLPPKSDAKDFFSKNLSPIRS